MALTNQTVSMFQATRRRLALWYTVVTALLLLVFALGFFWYVRATLIERIDDTLSHVAALVERSLILEPTEAGLIWSIDGRVSQTVNVEASFRNNALVQEDDDRIDLEWFGPDRTLLWSTFTDVPDLPLQLERKNKTVLIPQTRYDEPVLLRQLTEPVQLGRQTLGYLRLSHPWFEVTKPTQQLLRDLALGTVLMISAVAVIGWLLSELAMRPVRDSYQRLKQFTADASHELRSPVAMIQTNLQATLATSEIEPQQRQQLQLIERLTQRLGRLVDNLLFLARQDSGIAQVQKTQVLLDEVLLEVLEEQMTPAATKQITLDFQLPEQPELHDRDFAVWGDRDQLIRLFTNLISNALQYTPMSGQVTVQLGLSTNQKTAYPKSSGQKFSGQKTTSHNNPTQRPSQAGSETIQIKIRDTGIGIQADSLPHIFERFYRVDPARSSRPNAEISGSTSNGTGLGLAIAQSIVQTHQGMIQIQSELEHGTCVSVTLPLLPQAQVDSLIQISPD